MRKNTHEIRQTDVNALAEWRAEVLSISAVHVRTQGPRSAVSHCQLYIKLAEPLPMPYMCGDNRFKKVFLYLKNSAHKGMWHIKNMEADRKEIICENKQRNDGTGISWELDIEMNPSPRIVESETDRSVEFVDEYRAVVIRKTEVNTEAPIFARLTPPVVISCRATILSISCINLVDQSFIADVHFVFTAHNIGKIAKQDTFKHIRSQHLLHQETFDIDKAVKEFAEYYDFQKAIGFRHCRSKMDEGLVYSSAVVAAKADADGTCNYCYIIVCKFNAVYNSAFNLREYPFDEQKLTIAMIFNLDQYSARLTENLYSRSTFLHNNFHMHDMFEVVYGPIVMTEVSFTDPVLSSVGASYSVVDFSVTLRRKYSYFIGNFILPIMIMAAIAPLIVDTALFKDRMQIVSMLCLTVVTYKLMLVDILPPLSYMTTLNYYIMHCFFYIVIVAIFSVYPNSDVKKERRIQYILCSTFVISHILAYAYLHIAIFRRHAVADKLIHDFEEKFAKMNLIRECSVVKIKSMASAANSVIAGVRWRNATSARSFGESVNKLESVVRGAGSKLRSMALARKRSSSAAGEELSSQSRAATSSSSLKRKSGEQEQDEEEDKGRKKPSSGASS